MNNLGRPMSSDVRVNRTRKRLEKQGALGEKLLEMSPYQDSEEFLWIDYVSKCLISLWSLSDKGISDHIETNHGKFSKKRALAQDLSDFNLTDDISSSEAQIWNAFRIVTASRVLRNQKDLISALSLIRHLQDSADSTFKEGFRTLIFCAKIECYIGMYDLLKLELADKETIGYSEHSLEKNISASYTEMISMIDRSIEGITNPNHSSYPDNPYLISRVSFMVEDRFYYVSLWKDVLYIKGYMKKSRKIEKHEKEMVKEISSISFSEIENINCQEKTILYAIN